MKSPLAELNMRYFNSANGLLISKLIYFTKLSKNKNFSEDEFTLKGYIKQYKDKKVETINSIYF